MPLGPDLAELQRYVRWDDGDLARLRALAPHVEPHLEDVARRFYERTREFEGAHAVFTGEEQITRLQASMVRWIRRVLTTARDAEYCRDTARIGSAHVRVGLPQRYVFGAMTLLRRELSEFAERALGDAAVATCHSVDRALDLELALMVQAYHDDNLERIHRVEQLARDDLGRALARSERRYENAVELAPDPVIGLRRDGVILMLNRAAERVSGWARDEALGRSFSELLVIEGQRAEIDAALREARVDAVGHSTALLQTRAGGTRTMDWFLSRIPDGTDRDAPADDVSVLAVGHDVTDEEALSLRTRRAEKLAAVGTLAAGLAHEIRNPLNGAQLHLTFLERELRRRKIDGPALDAMEVVRGEIRRLSALVQEFLDFARPKPLEKTRVSLPELCRKAAQIAKPERPGVTLDLDLPAVDLQIDLDADRMMQVLLNLLSNAVDAVGESGRVVLRVRRRPREAAIEVEDDGPGLPNTEAPVFDAFYTTKPNGTGLGLAIVHRIVTDHGGSVAVETRKGRTLFCATLPLVTEGTRP